MPYGYVEVEVDNDGWKLRADFLDCRGFAWVVVAAAVAVAVVSTAVVSL